LFNKYIVSQSNYKTNLLTAGIFLLYLAKKGVYKRYFNQIFIIKLISSVIKTTLAFSLISA
ncbi:hypothetical protein SASC598J21_001770, partial [Snodgrassella alvi SCGC AB-598-J21]